MHGRPFPQSKGNAHPSLQRTLILSRLSKHKKYTTSSLKIFLYMLRISVIRSWIIFSVKATRKYLSDKCLHNLIHFGDVKYFLKHLQNLKYAIVIRFQSKHMTDIVSSKYLLTVNFPAFWKRQHHLCFFVTLRSTSIAAT